MKFTAKCNFVLVGSVLGISYLILAYFFFPDFMGDDTFIHLEYARSLANGEGFAFSGNKTYGSTAPLWTLMCSLMIKIGIDGVWAIRLLNALFSLGVIFCGYLFSVNNFSSKGVLTFMSVMFFNALMWRWSISGMESSAAILGVLFLISFLQNPQQYPSIILGLLTGLMVLIRPEFLLFGAILGIIILFDSKISFSNKAIMLTAGLGVVTTWIVFAYYYFGTIVPNTFVSKSSSNFLNSFDNLWRNLGVISVSYFSFFIIGFVSSIYIFRNKKAIKFWDSTALFCIFIILGFYGYYLGKDVIILSRYSIILVPAFAYLAAKISEQIQPRLLASALVSGILFNLIFLSEIVIPDANKFVIGFQNQFKKIAEIINRESHQGISVALNDVGIIAYYTNARIYDLAGLTEPNRFKFNKKTDYILDSNPYFIIWRDDFSLIDLNDFLKNYEVVYESSLPSLGIQQSASLPLKVFRKKNEPK